MSNRLPHPADTDLSRRAFIRLAGAGAAGLALAACSGGAGSSSSSVAPSTPASSTSASAAGKPRSEWDELVEKAKAEAPLSWSTNETASYGMQPVLDEFTSKTGVKITFDTAPGGLMVDRTLAARQGGRYEMNVFSTSSTGSGQRMVGAKALIPIAPQLFLPDVVDKSLWWKGKHWYADAEDMYQFSFSGAAGPSSQRVLYNTNAINSAVIDALKSDWDWLDQKWAGRIVALDPTGPVSVNSYPDSYLFPWLGPEYARKLFSKQLNVTFVRDFRLAVDGILGGKWDFGIMLGGLADSSVLDLIKGGAPIAVARPKFPGQPAILDASQPPHTIAIADRAPSPNGSKLFLNWFLSKEGQSIRQEKATALVPPTLRTDVTSTKMVDPELAIDPAGDYVFYAKDPAYSVEKSVQAYAAVKAIYTDLRGT
jgi:ABC-type glycerol-3-phosphate transport system substrate-binding protein